MWNGSRLTALALLSVLSVPVAWGSVALRVADDLGHGVPCRVYLQGQGGKRILLGDTDRQGRFTSERECYELLKLVVSPLQNSHLAAERPCRSLSPDTTNTILVTKTAFLENLVENAALLRREDLHADAALACNEIHQRANAARPNLARIAQSHVYEDFARSIDFTGAPLEIDKEHGKFVMTADFEDAVRRFQGKHGLEETGIIDFSTLRQQAERGVFDYLTKRWTATELAEDERGPWRRVLAFGVTDRDRALTADLDETTVVVAQFSRPVGWEVGVYGHPVTEESENLLADGRDWRGPQPWQSFAWTKSEGAFPDVRVIRYGRPRRKLKIVLRECKTKKEGDFVVFTEGRIEVLHLP